MPKKERGQVADLDGSYGGTGHFLVGVKTNLGGTLGRKGEGATSEGGGH